MLATPSDLPIPRIVTRLRRGSCGGGTDTYRVPSLVSRDSTSMRRGPGETVDELGFMLDETKGRRRFQGFGGIYGEALADRQQGGNTGGERQRGGSGRAERSGESAGLVQREARERWSRLRVLWWRRRAVPVHGAGSRGGQGR